eukprot:6208319-Pleurochrysis_carterae.AAC.1
MRITGQMQHLNGTQRYQDMRKQLIYPVYSVPDDLRYHTVRRGGGATWHENCDTHGVRRHDFASPASQQRHRHQPKFGPYKSGEKLRLANLRNSGSSVRRDSAGQPKRRDKKEGKTKNKGSVVPKLWWISRKSAQLIGAAQNMGFLGS